jgi:adenosylcobyric acid synthase
MILGATSGAGKSLITTAICRILADREYRVAPFKPQNMSLNSFVTADGAEIGRAQALQAQAARVVPTGRMNPILLKPKGGDVSQIIVDGRPLRDMAVKEYYDRFVRDEAPGIVLRAYCALERSYDYLVIEGAGGCAEINRSEDIANMGTADLVDAPCLLVVNIERGGAFAYIYGTFGLLSEAHRRRIKGIIINNMRGDAEMLRPGIERLEKELGIPVLGVVPHLDIQIPMEDTSFVATTTVQGMITIGVIRLPRLSNSTDFDALDLEEGVSVRYIDSVKGLEDVDAVIIPGTKNTIEDLAWLRARGLDSAIVRLRGKVPILGICGGYQMLGAEIRDPSGLEGSRGQEVAGLGLLSLSTSFDSHEKRTIQVAGTMIEGGGSVRGYEIHMGRSDSRERPLFHLDGAGWGHDEGAISLDGMVLGTYLHGVFDLPAFRLAFLGKARPTQRRTRPRGTADVETAIEENIRELASAVAAHLDVPKLIDILEGVV